MRSAPYLLAALLLVALAQGASAVTFDLGTYGVSDPRITLTYTKDVHLLMESSFLVNTDSGEEYGLVLEDPTVEYARTFTLLTDAPLSPGQHTLVLSSEDRITGSSSVDTATFGIIGMEIVLIEPPFGIALSKPFDLLFITMQSSGEDALATCGYNILGWDKPMQGIDSEPRVEHVIEGISHNGYVYIACTEGSGRTTRKRVMVGSDSTPPVINITVNPTKVIDPREKLAVLKIRTDENTTCAVDEEGIDGDVEDIRSYRSYREHALAFDDVIDENEHLFTYTVSCTNLAGLSSSVEAEVTVHLGQLADIAVLNPPVMTRNTTFDAIIRPGFVADRCTMNGTAMAKTSDTFTLRTTVSRDGTHSYLFNCTGAKSASRVYSFMVDRTGPVMDKITILDSVCSNGNVEASFLANDTASGVASYTFRIKKGTELIRDGTSSAAKARVKIPKNVTGTLTWEVFATDVAGNNGSSKSVDAPCTAASDDDDFPPGPGGTTKPPTGNGTTGKCTSDLQCALDKRCEIASGACVPKGSTVEACTADFECELGEICQTGTGLCVLKPKDTVDDQDDGMRCASSFECDIGQDCVGGVCKAQDIQDRPIFPDDQDMPAEAGISWLALVMIILGLLLMGGAGYFLYEQNEVKRHPAPRSAAAQLPTGPRLPPGDYPGRMPTGPSPDELARIRAAQAAADAAARQQAIQAREQAKSEQRKAVFDSFGGRSEQDQKAPAAQRPKPSVAKQRPNAGSQKAAASKPKKAKDDEVFDELEKLGK